MLKEIFKTEPKNMYEAIKGMSLDEMVEHHRMFAITVALGLMDEVPDKFLDERFSEVMRDSLTEEFPDE